MDASTFLEVGAVGITYLILGPLVLLLAKSIKDWLTPYRIDQELTQADNPAMGVTVAGYFLGVVIIFLGATIGPEPEEALVGMALARSLGVDFLWALGGILALNLGRVVVDRLVLPAFSTTKEIVQDRNAGVGAVEFGAYVATAFTIAGAIHGEGGGILTALVFFGLGQLVLIAFARFYQLITRYDVHAELERDNTAAGVALGLSLVAIGIVMLKATSGDFVSWSSNLQMFATEAVVGFVLLMLLRWITDVMLLPGTTMAKEIARDRNVNAAWIEGVVAIGLASVIFFMI